MIDVVKQTPLEYSKQSRDYQVLARLYTALYNINKMYIDNMQVWNNDIDNKLTTLRSRTLNFIPKHSWDLDDLDAAMSCFKYMMRRKGTIPAIEFCLTILMRIKKLSGKVSEEDGTLIVNHEENKLEVRIPQQLASVGVVEDLFDYLLPAGMTYRIIEYTEVGLSNNVTSIGYTDEITFPYENSEGSTPFVSDSELTIYGAELVNGEDNTPGSTIYKNTVSNP